MAKIVLVALLLSVYCFSPARAETPPLPERKTEALHAIQKSLDEEKRKERTLQSKLGSIEKQLSNTRDQLIKITSDVQKNEKTLSTLENKIKASEEEEIQLRSRLEEDYGSIANLILALQRIRRTPPESLIVRPGAPLQTAQSAMLLQNTLPAIHNRTKQLSDDLSRLEQIARTLKSDKTEAIAVQAKLKRKLEDMKNLVTERERLHNRTQADYKNRKQTVARLAKEAKTLMDLINRLEKERQSRQAGGRNLRKVAAYGNKMPAIGRTQLPVTGYLIKAFGDKDDIGAKNQGIMIESRPHALAVAPMGGIIRFAGTFKNYGNMVIIEHKNGYHSLIGGLEDVTAQTEARIKAGEPIGQLPQSSSRGGHPALYYELRYNGRPVDPAQTFSELKS